MRARVEVLMQQSVDTKTFLSWLSEAHRNGLVDIQIDFNRVTHPNSPLPFESFKGQITYLYVGLIAALLYGCRSLLTLGWTETFAMSVVISLLYWWIVRSALERWATRRILDRLLADDTAWEKLWRFGGVAIKGVSADAAQLWRAPADNWKDSYESLRR